MYAQKHVRIHTYRRYMQCHIFACTCIERAREKERHQVYIRVVGVTRMMEPKIGRKIKKDWIIKQDRGGYVIVSHMLLGQFFEPDLSMIVPRSDFNLFRGKIGLRWCQKMKKPNISRKNVCYRSKFEVDRFRSGRGRMEAGKTDCRRAKGGPSATKNGHLWPKLCPKFDQNFGHHPGDTDYSAVPFSTPKCQFESIFEL